MVKKELKIIVVNLWIELVERPYGWHLHLMDGNKDLLDNVVYQELKDALKAVKLIHLVVRSLTTTKGYNIVKIKKGGK